MVFIDEHELNGCTDEAVLVSAGDSCNRESAGTVRVRDEVEPGRVPGVSRMN